MALTNLSLAAGIARGATDAVPIVKQCLGSAMRIVSFAEKMDKGRQALRELADRTLQLVCRVEVVTVGRTLDARVETSLERILGARNGLYRLIADTFTVHQHVVSLSRELFDAVQELIVVQSLDVDHHAHPTHTAVDANTHFVGEFRLLGDWDVVILGRLFDSEDGENANAVVQYHRAHVDGKVLILRTFKGRIPHQSSLGRTHETTICDRIAVNDSILEEISSAQRSHPNVARIYGWSREGRERFTVFKSGHQPVHTALDNSPKPLITGLHWAVKVLDAVQHLEQMGIVWKPALVDPYALIDDQLQPIIGLQNDLGRIERDVVQPSVAHYHIFCVTLPLQRYAEWKSVPASHIETDLFTERHTALLSRIETILRDRYIFPQEEFSGDCILTDAAAKRLLPIFEDEVLYDRWHSESWMWANILLALDRNRSRQLMGILRIVYFAYGTGNDYIRLYGMDHDSERIVHDMYLIEVPSGQKDEVREMFGISAPSEDKRLAGHVIATGTYRMLLG